MSIPDCTLTTACFCMHKYNENSRSLEEVLEMTNALMEIPVYLVIYGDKDTIPLLKEKREKCRLSFMTIFIELEHNQLWSFQYLEKVKENRKQTWGSRDSRTSCESHLITCNKFDFVLQTIQKNPFQTTKFGWVDSFLGKDRIKICEHYHPNVLPYILSNISSKFHIQVLNVCDKKYKLTENKKEYYDCYRWVVCGGFFTCGKEIGKKILLRLKEIFIETTMLGFGHGEEMFYLEVLDEFYEDIHRSYGDYGQIWDNFITITRNVHYIYYFIIRNYMNYGYYRECVDCCESILKEFESFRLYDIPELQMKIYLDCFYALQQWDEKEAKSMKNRIIRICSQHPYLQMELEKQFPEFDLLKC